LEGMVGDAYQDLSVSLLLERGEIESTWFGG
jgi:hypothetical protein